MLLNAFAINSVTNQTQLSPSGILQRFEVQLTINEDVNNCSCSTSQQIEFFI